MRDAASDLSSLRNWMVVHAAEIDENPAAFAALEGALIDMLARERGVSVERLLELPELSARPHRFTAVIGDSEPARARWLWARYALFGFTDFKVKASRDAMRDREKLAPFRLPLLRLRLDANNLWRRPADCLDHLSQVGVQPFAVEEPLGAGDVAGFREVALRAGVAIVLDESFRTPAVLEELPADVRWVVNVRVSKLGGILRSLDAVGAARRCGVGIVVGCHVGETGLLARAALPVAVAAGDDLVAQEGAFGDRLLERDLSTPSPRFGFRGRIAPRRIPPPKAPGFGLEIDRSALLTAVS